MTIGVDLNSYRQMRTLVYEIIRDDIVNGDLSAGQRINLEQIAARLNVSRMPIREAIQRLEGEGFVCSRPHRGVFVVRPTEKEIVDTFDTRGLLEGFAAREACMTLRDEDFAEMEAVVARTFKYLDTGDYRGVVDQHDQFHALLLRATTNRVVAEMAANLLTRSRRLRFYALTVRESASQTTDHHAGLIEVLKRRNPDEAERALRDHIRVSRDIALQVALAEGQDPIDEDRVHQS